MAQECKKNFSTLVRIKSDHVLTQWSHSEVLLSFKFFIFYNNLLFQTWHRHFFIHFEQPNWQYWKKNWENSEDSEWARRLVTICRVVPTLILDLSLRSNGGYLTIQTTPWSNKECTIVYIYYSDQMRVSTTPIKWGLSYNTDNTLVK